MDLTKDDYKGWDDEYGEAIGITCKKSNAQKLWNQILKNQEKAKKYDKLNLCNECEQVNQHGVYEAKWTDRHTKIVADYEKKYKTQNESEEVDI